MIEEPGAGSGEEDPIVEACVRDALAPYLDLLSPAELAEHRIDLIAFITTHPNASHLYHRLRERRAVVAKSYEEAREGASIDTGIASAPKGRSGVR